MLPMESMIKMLFSALKIEPEQIMGKVEEAINAIEYFRNETMEINDRLKRIEKALNIEPEVIVLDNELVEDMRNGTEN